MDSAGTTQNKTEAEQKVEDLIQRSGILKRTGVIASLNAKLGEVDCASEDLISQVESDKELVAKLLVVANSAWFGTRTKITKVDEAYSRLGQTEFYNAVVTSALRIGLGETGNFCGVYWGHVDAIGQMNQLVAQHLAPGTESTVFILGLLHDAGIPPMVRCVTDYAYLAEEALGTDADITNTEVECCGFNHAHVSMELARKWGFREELTAGISFHHQSTLSNAPVECRKILANLMLTERIWDMCQGKVKTLFCSDQERRLLGEMSVAFGADEATIKGVVAELERLFIMRQKAA